jgi:hypothetical protein
MMCFIDLKILWRRTVEAVKNNFVCQYDLNSLRRGLTNQGDSFVNTHQSEVCI